MPSLRRSAQQRFDLSAPGPCTAPEWVQQLAEVALRKGLGEAERFGLLGGVMMRAKEEIHERRDVGVVAGETGAGVVPVVELGRTDEPAQESDIQADI